MIRRILVHDKCVNLYYSTKKRQHSFDTPQYEMSDSDRRVNRDIWLYAVTCDRMSLIGRKSDQVRPMGHSCDQAGVSDQVAQPVPLA